MIDQPVLFLLGISVLLFLCFDLFQTTAQGSEGPAARVVQRGIQHLLTLLYRLTGRRTVLVWSTSVLIFGLVSLWIALLYVGWLLVFVSDTTAVINAQDKAPATLMERVYFTGFTISTLGVGDYVPKGGLWQFLTTAAGLAGFFLLTFVISFLLSVTQKQSLRRTLALSIHHLGETPTELIVRHWQPAANSISENVLDLVLPDLIQFEQQHLDQPILNRFHGATARSSVQLAVAVLDEALTIAEFAITAALPPHFRRARQAISTYLETLDATSRVDTEDVPPMPDLSRLEAANIALRSPAAIDAAYARLRARRCKLLVLVRDSGWTWRDVEAAKGALKAGADEV